LRLRSGLDDVVQPAKLRYAQPWEADSGRRLREAVMTPDQYESLITALKFCRDLADEELPHVPVGTGAEVVLRHIRRKCDETLRLTERK
jgi:hypothetical protein